ncbi:hypothetical protein [Streptococcus oricebi]|uniref:Uncharacterized protein n=1 Tax=Streptococcus oricebi TaxID=1547447 RepID=A0ABS5B3X5_9STRE|nr:hypothetical protein [Streptococcus oricebi]MBP2623391.1 hypothetical protein [Streptococcus oricebi]
MDKQYLQDKLADLRSRYIESSTSQDSLISKYDQDQMTKKMLRIKKKLLALEMERCQKKIEHRDLSKVDQKISQQKTLFEKCCRQR